MSKKRFTAEQIIPKLREADVDQAKGRTVAQACKKIGVTEQGDQKASEQLLPLVYEELRKTATELSGRECWFIVGC